MFAAFQISIQATSSRTGRPMPPTLGGGGDRVPAARGPLLIGRGPAGGGADLARLEPRAVLVADAVQGAEHILGEACRLAKRRRRETVAEIGVDVFREGAVRPGRLGHGEENVGKGRAIGHEGCSASRRRADEAPGPSRESRPVKTCARREETYQALRERRVRGFIAP